MKKIISITIFLVLFAAFAIGQSKLHKSFVKSSPLAEDYHQKNMNPGSNKAIHNSFLKKSEGLSQIPFQKSIQDNKYRLDSVVQQNWESANNQWISCFREEYIYDANGNLLQDTFAEWCEYNQSFREEFTYDANGNMTKSVSYFWDENNSQWMKESEYTYNDTMAYYSYYYDPGDGSGLQADSSIIKYSFTENGKLAQSVYYNWDEDTDQWGNYYKEAFTYDTHDNLLLEIGYSWNMITSQWDEGNYKYEYTYDENGNLTQYEYFYKDYETSEWVYYEKETYTYDANGNIMQSDFYDWEESSSQLEIMNKGEYSYNNSVPSSDLILPFYDDFQVSRFNHMLTGFIL